MARNRSAVLAEIEATGVVAVIRADSGKQLVDTCRALVAGGVTACEITMTTPNAIEAIAQATTAIGDEALIGVGTVLDAETARAAILAGAQFVVSPSLDPATITMAHRYDRPVMPGALTPTEIVTAWSAGADIVKVFPANHFGPTYFKDLKGPFPHIRLDAHRRGGPRHRRRLDQSRGGMPGRGQRPGQEGLHQGGRLGGADGSRPPLRRDREGRPGLSRRGAASVGPALPVRRPQARGCSSSSRTPSGDETKATSEASVRRRSWIGSPCCSQRARTWSRSATLMPRCSKP